MTIHKEGYKTIAIATILFGIINILSFYYISLPSPVISWIIFIGTLGPVTFPDLFFPHTQQATHG
jgi:phosphatidylserine decarboxylase